jgi:hypothetical protein
VVYQKGIKRYNSIKYDKMPANWRPKHAGTSYLTLRVEDRLLQEKEKNCHAKVGRKMSYVKARPHRGKSSINHNKQGQILGEDKANHTTPHTRFGNTG